MIKTNYSKRAKKKKKNQNQLGRHIVKAAFEWGPKNMQNLSTGKR